MGRRPQGQQPGEAISNYMNDRTDSRLPRVLAAQSSLPASHAPQSFQYRGQPERSYGTSMAVSNNSEGTRYSSLPALTLATSRPTSSIASSVGVRAADGQQRLLELDHGGVLVVPPLQERRILECPFNLAYFCLMTFSNEEDWIEHSLTHFNTKQRAVDPPTSNRCCFCEEKFYSPRRFQSWADKMRHVCLHHCLGHRLAHARPDFEIFKYLFDNRLISDAEYRDLKGNSQNRSQRAAYPTPPTSPDTPVGPPPAIPVYTETNRGRRGDRSRGR